MTFSETHWKIRYFSMTLRMFINLFAHSVSFKTLWYIDIDNTAVTLPAGSVPKFV